MSTENATVETFNGTFEAEAPISHGADTSAGITQRLRSNRFDVSDPATGERYSEDVPVISGNALRGQLRDLLAYDFLERVSGTDDPLEVSDTLSNALYSGGALERGTGAGKLRRRRIQSIREHVPMLSLLGTAIGSQMIEGKLDMGILLPLCMETRSYTGRGDEETRSVYEAFVDTVYYTRRDDREGGRQEDEDVQQMRYRVHVLVPGTRFDHDMTLKDDPNEIERACLGHAFELFNDRPVIGGMAAKGHGRVNFEYDHLPDSAAYTEYVENHTGDIREFLTNLDEDLN